MVSSRQIRNKSPLRKGLLAIAMSLGMSLLSHAADKRGEFGGDLGFLSSCYSPPQVPGESNFFIDMWEGQRLRAAISLNRMTNNHTLFVNSHGKALDNRRFAFYPHQTLLREGFDVPYYSAGDIADVIGYANARAIHNIVLAACNAEGTFSTADLRRYFPYATNIIHSASGELGYQAMFLQAIVNPSWNVKPVYEWCERNEKGEVEYITGPVPIQGAKRFAPYMAEIFRLGANEPFRVQRAGRELLEPEQPRTMTSNKR
jgi:hypothetical protein